MTHSRISLAVVVALVGVLFVPSSERLSAQSSPTLRLYPGPERPADQVAILTFGSVYENGKDDSSFGALATVNGCGLWPVSTGWPRRERSAPLALLPGEHVLFMAVDLGGPSFWYGIKVNAGHTYKLLGRGPWKQRTRPSGFAVLDLATNRDVAELLPAVTVDVSVVEDDSGRHRVVTYSIPAAGHHIRWSASKDKGFGRVRYVSRDPLFPNDLLPYRWELNWRGIALRDGEKYLAYQHVMAMRGAEEDTTEMIVGDGTPIFPGLIPWVPVPGSDKPVELLRTTPSQVETLSGLARKIALGLAEQHVTKFRSVRFYFTHAVGGDFVAEITIRGANREEQTFVFVEKE